MKIGSNNFYKIVEKDSKGNIKTLFHGLNGSRKLPFNKWLSAEFKIVTDGSKDKSTSYMSGFHVFDSLDKCREYMKYFKNTNNKYIVQCGVIGFRKKEHSRGDVFLADSIFIYGFVE